jgi:hypothetical protein
VGEIKVKKKIVKEFRRFLLMREAIFYMYLIFLLFSFNVIGKRRYLGTLGRGGSHLFWCAKIGGEF